ncbi:hypothetical protein PGB90_000944 [Kerria lacca]
MATLFFDIHGPILIEFLPQGTTINSDRYCDTLMKLKAGVKSKRRGEKKFTNSPILLHNARPHTARLSQSMIHEFG